MEDLQRQSTGAVIRTLREAQGLTRPQLVALTSAEPAERISVEMLAKVEQGKKAPSARTLRKIALALGLDSVDLSRRVAWWEAALTVGESSSILRAGALDATRAVFSAVRGAPVALPIAGAALVGAHAVKESRDRIHAEQALRKQLERKAAELKAHAAELDEVVREGTPEQVAAALIKTRPPEALAEDP